MYLVLKNLGLFEPRSRTCPDCGECRSNCSPGCCPDCSPYLFWRGLRFCDFVLRRRTSAGCSPDSPGRSPERVRTDAARSMAWCISHQPFFFFSNDCMVVFAWRSSPSCRLGRRYSRQHSTRRLSAQAQNISAGVSEAPPCLPIIPPNSTSQKPSACFQTSNSSMTTSRHVSRTSSTGGREARAPQRNRKKVC